MSVAGSPQNALQDGSDDAFSMPCPPASRNTLCSRPGMREAPRGLGSRHVDASARRIEQPRRHPYLKEHAVCNILSWIPDDCAKGVAGEPGHSLQQKGSPSTSATDRASGGLEATTADSSVVFATGDVEQTLSRPRSKSAAAPGLCPSNPHYSGAAPEPWSVMVARTRPDQALPAAYEPNSPPTPRSVARTEPSLHSEPDEESKGTDEALRALVAALEMSIDLAKQYGEARRCPAPTEPCPEATMLPIALESVAEAISELSLADGSFAKAVSFHVGRGTRNRALWSVRVVPTSTPRGHVATPRSPAAGPRLGDLSGMASSLMRRRVSDTGASCMSLASGGLRQHGKPVISASGAMVYPSEDLTAVQSSMSIAHASSGVPALRRERSRSQGLNALRARAAAVTPHAAAGQPGSATLGSLPSMLLLHTYTHTMQSESGSLSAAGAAMGSPKAPSADVAPVRPTSLGKIESSGRRDSARSHGAALPDVQSPCRADAGDIEVQLSTHLNRDVGWATRLPTSPAAAAPLQPPAAAVLNEQAAGATTGVVPHCRASPQHSAGSPQGLHVPSPAAPSPVTPAPQLEDSLEKVHSNPCYSRAPFTPCSLHPVVEGTGPGDSALSSVPASATYQAVRPRSSPLEGEYSSHQGYEKTPETRALCTASEKPSTPRPRFAFSFKRKDSSSGASAARRNPFSRKTK